MRSSCSSSSRKKNFLEMGMIFLDFLHTLNFMRDEIKSYLEASQGNVDKDGGPGKGGDGGPTPMDVGWLGKKGNAKGNGKGAGKGHGVLSGDDWCYQGAGAL